MKFIRTIRNQRQIVEVDIKTPSTFARAITSQQLVSSAITQVLNATDHSALLKKLQTTVRPYAVCLVTQLEEK